MFYFKILVKTPDPYIFNILLWDSLKFTKQNL